MTTPLTPEDCDLRDFPFMPLDVGRLRDSDLASEEAPDACWAALLLWCASWHQIPAASIPDSDQWQAKTAGYVSRGRVDAAWKKVKAGALRGWIMCSDGRLYHPVVAEKALDAWRGKLRRIWLTECARVKKHNQRHADAPPVVVADFDTWLTIGRPHGLPLPVPKDNPQASPGTAPQVPRETGSKGKGEGQGEGQGQGDLPDRDSDPDGSAGDPAFVVRHEAEALAKRRLWADSGNWLVANGLTSGDAKAFLNSLAKDYPQHVADALREAIKEPAPADCRAYATGIAKRLAGERKPSLTVPSKGPSPDQIRMAQQEAELASITPEQRAETARRVRAEMAQRLGMKTGADLAAQQQSTPTETATEGA